MARRRRKSLGWRGKVLGIGFLAMAIVFIPTAIMLLVGMLPAIVAALFDKSRRAAKAITVGAMNLAGCSPFLIQLWTKGNSVSAALSIIMDPRTVVVIYSAAAIGYLIDWALSGLVAGVMLQKGQQRTRDIGNLQADLIRRWGPEVAGDIPLDAYGFPLGSGEDGEV